MSRHPVLDRRLIQPQPLAQRGHGLYANACTVLPVSVPAPSFPVSSVCGYILSACDLGSSVLLLFGGHPIKLGLSRYLIDLIERGFITHLASNGSALIHDFELALVGTSRAASSSTWARP